MLRRSPLCDLIVHSDSGTLFLTPTCSFVGFSLASAGADRSSATAETAVSAVTSFMLAVTKRGGRKRGQSNDVERESNQHLLAWKVMRLCSSSSTTFGEGTGSGRAGVGRYRREEGKGRWPLPRLRRWPYARWPSLLRLRSSIKRSHTSAFEGSASLSLNSCIESR